MPASGCSRGPSTLKQVCQNPSWNRPDLRLCTSDDIHGYFVPSVQFWFRRGNGKELVLSSKQLSLDGGSSLPALDVST